LADEVVEHLFAVNALQLRQPMSTWQVVLRERLNCAAAGFDGLYTCNAGPRVHSVSLIFSCHALAAQQQSLLACLSSA
jgi:hypothetical protein